MSAMTTMSAAFCVKAPVRAKASAKVRIVERRVGPRHRARRLFPLAAAKKCRSGLLL